MTTYQKWVAWVQRNQVYGERYSRLYARLRLSPADMRDGCDIQCALSELDGDVDAEYPYDYLDMLPR